MFLVNLKAYHTIVQAIASRVSQGYENPYIKSVLLLIDQHEE
jgi:hypothetical protein